MCERFFHPTFYHRALHRSIYRCTLVRIARAGRSRDTLRRRNETRGGGGGGAEGEGRDETAVQVCRNEIHRATILNFRITVTFATAENYPGKRNFGNVCNNGRHREWRAFARP